jgi:hypothetical protein
VNSQNSRHWSAENPGLIHELPLRDENVGVWCAVSAHRVIGPIFYDYTVTAVRYAKNTLRPFFAELTQEERLYGVFQQDSSTAQTTHVSLETLREVFDDRVISRGLWPPRSPGLTPCDVYLWGSLKGILSKHNVDKLQESTLFALYKTLAAKNVGDEQLCFMKLMSAKVNHGLWTAQEQETPCWAELLSQDQ